MNALIDALTYAAWLENELVQACDGNLAIYVQYNAEALNREATSAANILALLADA